MSKPKVFHGTITALVTPLDEDRVDFDALGRHVERQIAAGVDGLVPCGTTGESPTLSHAEHDQVVEFVVRQTKGRVPVIAGAGSNSTAEAVRLARKAAETGADGVLVVNPYYNRPPQAGMERHFGAIAGAMDLPVMLYNIPGRTAVTLENTTIARLRERHSNITMVKHATGRVDDAAALASMSDIVILSGDDPITLPLMAIGAVGVVSVISNLAPRAMTRLTSAILSGDLAAGREAHKALWPLMSGLLGMQVNPIPIKTACAIRGWMSDSFRSPLCEMDADGKVALRKLLDRFPLD
ncbi:MAG: 4-hydroxy-tetrahydrodipicolinate synthase [Phycisphaerales bacterium]|nr:4-hydroxy-tetrahydrodipicolinate synthase [Phycisphaerales bacterium]